MKNWIKAFGMVIGLIFIVWAFLIAFIMIPPQIILSILVVCVIAGLTYLFKGVFDEIDENKRFEEGQLK